MKIALGKLLMLILGLLSGLQSQLAPLCPHRRLHHAVGSKIPAPYNDRSLILAGSAAGFTALFNAPLAGITFAVEGMGRRLDEKITNMVLMTIVLSGIIAYPLLDNRIYIADEQFSSTLNHTWLAVPLCGVAGGVLGGLFSKATILGSQLLNRAGISLIIVALLSGVVIAAVNYYSHGATAGAGYQQTKMILQNSASMEVTFPFIKLLATWATFFSSIRAEYSYRHWQPTPGLALT